MQASSGSASGSLHQAESQQKRKPDLFSARTKTKYGPCEAAQLLFAAIFHGYLTGRARSPHKHFGVL